MEDKEKQQLVTRLNIVMQQRDSFLNQIVLLQEQVETLTKELKELTESPKKTDVVE